MSDASREPVSVTIARIGILVGICILCVMVVILLVRSNEYYDYEVEGVISEIDITAGGLFSYDKTVFTFENGSVLALDGSYDEFAYGDHVWMRVGVRMGNHSIEDWERVEGA